jgi:hypothetical protein
MSEKIRVIMITELVFIDEASHILQVLSIGRSA